MKGLAKYKFIVLGTCLKKCYVTEMYIKTKLLDEKEKKQKLHLLRPNFW